MMLLKALMFVEFEIRFFLLVVPIMLFVKYKVYGGRGSIVNLFVANMVLFEQQWEWATNDEDYNLKEIQERVGEHILFVFLKDELDKLVKKEGAE